MALIKVKWGKEQYDVEVELSSTVMDLRQQLHALTCVPVEKQKLMGLKPSKQANECTLAEAGLAAGKTIMLIGSAEGTAIPVVEAVKQEVESGHAASAPTSNGLVNIANTCYMNSALQMVRSMPEIKETLTAYTGTNAFLRELGLLLNTLDSTKEAATPLKVWTSLIRANAIFGERDDHQHFMQHDSQEALNTMLEQITPVLPEKYQTLYRGQLEQTLTCTEDPDDTGKVTATPFTMLQCNIGGEVQTLEAGLEQAFADTFTAPSAKLGKQDAEYKRVSRVAQLPEYLIVQMVRFSWKADIQKKAKILKQIAFPMVLDMDTNCTAPLKEELVPVRAVVKTRRDKELERRKRGRQEIEEDKLKNEEEPDEVVPLHLHNESGYYELCGVISHKGRGADDGHYVYWGKKAGQWLVFDDANVAAVSEEDIKRLRGGGEAHVAYVLLYRSRDPLSHKPVIPI